LFINLFGDRYKPSSAVDNSNAVSKMSERTVMRKPGLIGDLQQRMPG
jgi:hypothetical protein